MLKPVIPAIPVSNTVQEKQVQIALATDPFKGPYSYSETQATSLP